jgi:4a-hydroxytetrahydrobiopterin dehydratase
MSHLLEKRCVDYKPGSAALSVEEQQLLGAQVPLWENLDGQRLRRTFKFDSYLAGVSWVHSAALIAEQEDHHPDIHIFWRKVVVELWTHTVKGLSENDFIVAAKLDQLFEGSCEGKVS